MSTFGLPDLRGRTPCGAGSSSSLGQASGTETVTLMAQQIGAHTHTLSVSGAGTSANPANAHPGVSTGNSIYEATANATLAAGAIAPNPGGNQPHDNVQPYLAIAFCISTQGVYPSQQ